MRAAARAPAAIPVKGRDCWWTVLVIDPLAGPLVRAVGPVRWITPNVLTALSVLLAFGAAAAYALDRLVLGALLFQASFLVDCMDGKLAGLRGLRNPYGGFVDAVGDAMRFTTCVGGLVFAVASAASRPAGWVMLLALFPAVHYARLVVQKAWPDGTSEAPALVTATPTAMLASARHRLSQPGTTVDTEALAFTVGPLAGRPLAGIAAALAIDAARLLVTLVTRLWHAERHRVEHPTGLG